MWLKVLEWVETVLFQQVWLFAQSFQLLCEVKYYNSVKKSINNCFKQLRPGCNLGVMFDQHMTFIPQVNKVCHEACLAISKICPIQKCIDIPVTEHLGHAYFVTSSLDNNNSLLVVLQVLQYPSFCRCKTVLMVRLNINNLHQNELHSTAFLCKIVLS